MDGNGDQGMVAVENPVGGEQLQELGGLEHDVGMEESEDYYYEGGGAEDYNRHQFAPRGRGGFRYTSLLSLFSYTSFFSFPPCALLGWVRLDEPIACQDSASSFVLMLLHIHSVSLVVIATGVWL